jgi:hypothetical protein
MKTEATHASKIPPQCNAHCRHQLDNSSERAGRHSLVVFPDAGYSLSSSSKAAP